MASIKLTFSRLRHVLGLSSWLYLALFMFGSTISEVVLNLLESKLAQLIFTALTGFLVLALALKKVFEISKPSKEADTTSLSSRKGLVILVGLSSAESNSPVTRLLKASNPTHIAFLGTPQTATSGVIDKVRAKILPVIGKDLPASNVFVSQTAGALDMHAFKVQCSKAIAWMLESGLSPGEILVDTTEGRRAMGYGSLEAANEFKVDVQYLADDRDVSTPKNSAERDFVVIKNQQY